jgi:hypothetical protein
MVTAHTYYLARWDRCYGERAGDVELCGLLRREWTRRSDRDDATIVDGLSAWVDEVGTVRICMVADATPHMIDDPDLARELAPHLGAGGPSLDLTHA